MGMPLIVVIDELDRCSPSFALILIETIKHFFAVENVVFVLSINRGQLENHVRKQYGVVSSPGVFLEKFIDLRLQLRGKEPNTSLDVYKAMTNHLLVAHGFVNRPDIETIDRGLFAGLVSFKLSIRQAEKAANQLAFAILSINGNLNPPSKAAIALWCCYFTKHPDDFREHMSDFSKSEILRSQFERGRKIHEQDSVAFASELYYGLVIMLTMFGNEEEAFQGGLRSLDALPILNSIHLTSMEKLSAHRTLIAEMVLMPGIVW